MKLKFKFLLMLSSIVLIACSNDNSIDDNDSNLILDDNIVLNKINPSNYEHVISYSNYDAGVYSNGAIDLFKNDKIYNKINYLGDLGYTVTEFTDKYRIVDSKNSNVYFEIKNVTKTSLDKSTELIEFDVVTSDGTVLNGFEYETAKACPWCWVVGVVVTVVDAIVDVSTESDCQTAINACVEAGGFPTTEIIEGIFTSSCSVKCN